MSNSQGLMAFSNDNFFSQQVLSSLDHQLFMQNFQPEVAPAVPVVNRKRKAMDVSSSGSGSSSYHLVTKSEMDEKKYKSSRKEKKVKPCDSGEAPKEVVHVRAKRGQATDSHSIAERVRREKINERLRCFQNIVPGCYKSMGMAVMLDEIINYVQSLKSQVEFLSLKLTEASRFHNFDSVTHIDTFQMGNAFGVKMQRPEEMEHIGPVDQSFG
ncbi:hypothetical protein L1987_79099 [Smallanthus sonchifolius]|uniref:Uncharacterized protein n=1 Tax=Smallanthus sonchifolius TaxID=185202 RepID=A0ACB8ZFJ6_9ASTR|nr:hypothetical protein L1987_79099 [Smallanthus sonchifolius]